MCSQKKTVEQLLESHNEAVFSKNFEKIVEDYSDDALLVTLYGTFKGKESIKAFFKKFLLEMMPNMKPVDSPNNKLIISDDTLIIRWCGESDIAKITDGVDTFIEKDGKIWRQTGCFDIVTK